MKINQGNKQEEANEIYWTRTSFLSLGVGNYFNNILAFFKHLRWYNSKPGQEETLKIQEGGSSSNRVAITCPLFAIGFTTGLPNSGWASFFSPAHCSTLTKIYTWCRFAVRNSKKFLVYRIGDLWRLWMVKNWSLGLICIIQSVWNHSGPSEVPYSANQ